MARDPEEQLTAARWRFLTAYWCGGLEALRRQINQSNDLRAKRGNMNAAKHGARSKRVLWCMRYGSLGEWRRWLGRINEVEKARAEREVRRKLE